MEIVKITGKTPFDRGVMHGKLLRKRIYEYLELENVMSELEDIGNTLRNEPKVMDPINKYTPWLFEEIQGISEGSGISLNIIFAIQAADQAMIISGELDKFITDILGGPSSDSPSQGNDCTVIGAFNQQSQPTLLAQNADKSIIKDGFQTLFHIVEEENDIEILTLAYPGDIGIYGMNNHGVGVCINAIHPTLNYELKGLPQVFLVRGILRQKNVKDARAFVDQLEFNCGVVMNFGDATELVSYELSANQSTQFISPDRPNMIYHTNHPMVNDDYNEAILKLMNKYQSSFMDLATQIDAGKNSLSRMEILEKHIYHHVGDFTVEDIKQVLRSHENSEYPICIHGERNKTENHTNFSMIMELSGTPKLHVTDGPPCDREYKTYTFD